MQKGLQDQTGMAFWTGDARAAEPSDVQSHQLLRALPIAVYTTDAKGRITFFNEAAADLWGVRPELGKNEWCGSWRLYWPDGRPMPHNQCPMAVALRENRAIRGAEAIAERPDGNRVPFLAFPTPLRDEDGNLTGAVNTLVNIAEKKQAERAAQQLAAIVQFSDDAIVSKDLSGIVMTWNRGAERLFGYAAQEMIGKPIRILIPAERQAEEDYILDCIRRGEHIDHYETIRMHKDGRLVEISLTVSPIEDRNGRIVCASKIARDITDRKRAEDQQKLLIKEMKHRIKNVFAVASSVVSLSARTAASTSDMAEAVRERLAALNRAQELTLPKLVDDKGGTADKGTTLHALIETIFSPYLSGQLNKSQCVVAEGPEIPISGNAVTSMALILHELTTNALKYGALSTPDGTLHLGWVVENDTLAFTWHEQGGPPVNGQPQEQGFGSLLARRTVTSALAGQLDYGWNVEGLSIHLSVPMERLGNGS